MGPTFAAHEALIWAPHVIAGWETALLTALLFSVTSNQTNYCFPRYNAVTVTDNKMRRYYNLLYIIRILFFSSSEWMRSVAVFDVP